MKTTYRLIARLLLPGCFVAAIIIASCTSTNPAGADQSDIEQQLQQIINHHRDSLGLSELTINSTISKQARDHSTKMAEGARPLGHDGFFERTTAITQTIDIDTIAENVKFTFSGGDAMAATVQAWLNNPDARKNIEGRFDMTGIGIVQDNTGDYYFTQIFVRRK